jgi:hypothetical protein
LTYRNGISLSLPPRAQSGSAERNPAGGDVDGAADKTVGKCWFGRDGVLDCDRGANSRMDRADVIKPALFKDGDSEFAGTVATCASSTSLAK